MGPDPALNPELIQAQSFTSSFRGYDQTEVRSFLGRVAAEVRSLRERVEQLDSAWHSAEERAARPPVIDEDTLMSAVGEETAAILRTARAAAADMRSKAAEEADRMVGEATAEADRIALEARTRDEQESRQAHESAERAMAAAHAEGAQLVERARTEADGIRLKAEQDRALTVEGANATRDRILEDLVRRRKVAEVQIEQLRAGRERLMESYAVVRRTLEEAQSELSRADAEARAAAEEVGRRMRGYTPPQPPPQPSVGVILDEPAPQPAEGADGVATADSTVEASGESGPAGGAEEAPDDPEDADTPAEPGGPPSAVDELFARMRSSGRGKTSTRRSRKAAAGAGTATITRVGEPAPVGTDEGSVISAPEATGDRERVLPASDGPEKDVAGSPEATEAVPGPADPAPAGSASAGSATADPAPSEADAVLDADESLLQGREAALADLEAGLARKLKRTMQDEQNDLLDRLRTLDELPVATAMVPTLDRHLASYETAAAPLLEQAFTAGASFAREILELPAGSRVQPRVDDLAAGAATAIVEPLRRRLETALTAVGSDDQAGLVQSVGAAYREWKGQRIERIAGDALYAAFAVGTWNASPAGTSMRWVVDDVDGPCPDCDDDALAGLLPKGEEFPTGQAYPPAHSGCRCLLVPSTS
jgi:DivIVA domain-containing protein